MAPLKAGVRIQYPCHRTAVRTGIVGVVVPPKVMARLLGLAPRVIDCGAGEEPHVDREARECEDVVRDLHRRRRVLAGEKVKEKRKRGNKGDGPKWSKNKERESSRDVKHL